MRAGPEEEAALQFSDLVITSNVWSFHFLVLYSKLAQKDACRIKPLKNKRAKESNLGALI
eukprot:scaffold144033_cov19-Tisochrysis_lutea.AAC.2